MDLVHRTTYTVQYADLKISCDCVLFGWLLQKKPTSFAASAVFQSARETRGAGGRSERTARWRTNQSGLEVANCVVRRTRGVDKGCHARAVRDASGGQTVPPSDVRRWGEEGGKVVGLAVMEGGGTLPPFAFHPDHFRKSELRQTVRDCGDDSGTLELGTRIATQCRHCI